MGEEKQVYAIILRHDTSTLWMANDPILLLGEYGVEDDTHKVKRGNGESKWSELPYEDFGLKYIVTFENLTGEIEDNLQLTTALNEKIDKNVFEDIGNTIVAGIQLTNDEDGTIARLLKTTKNVVNNTTQNHMVYIKSNDNSIRGAWSTDETGAQILNLSAESTINNYKKDYKYCKDEICFYNNKLYRAIENFTATSDFNPDQWILLSSLHSSDISYDNLISGLDSTTVKGAIDELKRRLDNKVNISTELGIVYGTSKQGEQTVIPIDDLRKVDTVNHIAADTSKNIQIDANQINYSDINPELGTIKTVLDTKVDNAVAGKGAKIVRNVTLNYIDENGTFELVTDKVSLEDGTSEEVTKSIDIVSEQELTNVKNELQGNIDGLAAKTTQDIANAVEEVNQTIADTKQTIEQELNSGLNTKIDKDIADNIVTDIVLIGDDEPTIKITRKNTSSKEAIENNIHFKTNGSIKAIFEDADHIVIDSSSIDTSIEQINTTLGDVDTKLKNNEKEIAALQEHDVNHESVLATHTQQIAALETKTADNSTRITNAELSITDIKNTNAQQEAHLTRLDETDATHTQQIQDNADALVETNKNVSSLLDDVATLKNTAVVYNEERNIDVENNIALRKNMMLTGATPTQYYNLASMRTYNEGLENEEIQTEYGTIHVHMNLNSKDRPTIELPGSDKHGVAYKDELDTVNGDLTEQLETANSEIANLKLNKIDKTFTETLVNKTAYVAPDGIELLKIQTTNITPANNETSTEEFTFKSSDNTIVAKPIMQEDKLIGIDLATNLDTDVNYFVTSETLSTTIPDDNTIQLSSLTATDKQTVEVQDIISDAEGTWARVKSVDTEGGTCVAVTFHKHAQAVWGTIKGTIDDQLDLKSKLAEKLNTTFAANVQNNIVGKVIFSLADDETGIDITTTMLDVTALSTSEHKSGITSKTGDIIFTAEDTGIDLSINAEKIKFETQESGILASNIGAAIRELKGNVTTNTNEINQIQLNKLDKVSTPNIIYGTNSEGVQTNIDIDSLGKVDTVNGITPVEKNITLTANNINLESEAEKTIETKLTELVATLNDMKNALLNHIQDYASGTQYYKKSTYVNQNFVTITRADGIMLMAKIANDFTSSASAGTAYDNFVIDVTAGNLVLVGIPEQTGETNIDEVAAEAMNILNQVDGVSDSYEGLGGTESEVSQIMDEIIGQ